MMTIEEMKDSKWAQQYLAMLEHSLKRYDQAVEMHGPQTPLYGYVCEALMGFAGDVTFAPSQPPDTPTVAWRQLRDKPFDLNTDNLPASIGLIQAYTQSIPLLASDPMVYLPHEKRTDILSKLTALEGRAHEGGLMSKHPLGVMLVSLKPGCSVFHVTENGSVAEKTIQEELFVVKTNRTCPVLIGENTHLLTPSSSEAKKLFESIARDCEGEKQTPINGIIDDRFYGKIEIPGAYSLPDPEEVEKFEPLQPAI